jgi:lambda family phage tail tape measure protein
MADLRYSADIDVRSAVSSLNSLKSQVLGFGAAVAGAFAFRELTQISSRFEDLRTTLQLLYKDQALGAAAFDDIKKFAEGSIFSVEDLTNTIVKLKAAGLEPTVSLLRLFADTSSVAADKVGALQAITDLYARTTAGGLGLEDLNRLADRGIPVFTILSERLGLSRLEISKIGQTAEGAQLILKALEQGLQETFGGASASRANNVSQAFSNLGDAFSNAADTVGQSGLNQGLTDLAKAFANLINSIQPFLKLLGQALGPVLSFISRNIEIFAAFLAGLALSFAVVTVQIIAQTKAVRVLTGSYTLLSGVIAKSPFGRIAAALALAGIAVAEFSGLLDSSKESADDLAQSNGFKVLQDGNLGAGTENLKEKMATLNQELNKFRVEMESVVSSFARYNKQNVDALNLETSLLGTSRELQSLRRAESDISKKLTEEIARLTEEKAKLSEEEKKQGRAEIINSTIKKLEEQAKADKASAAAAIEANEAKMRSDNLRLFGIQSQIDVQRDLRKIQDDIAKSTMGEMARKEYDILAASRERAEAEINAEQARRGSLLTDQEKLKFYEAAKQGTNELIAAERQLYAESRTFSTGWKKAFQEYTDNATNAAQSAQRIFQKATQGMEDAFVKFARTGKLSFKDLIDSMLEELLRSQIRQVMSQVLSISGGTGQASGGSLFGGIGSFLGFANGGVIPTNEPVIVGERGPELLMGAAGRNVIPNEKLGSSNYVTYNINATDARSFKDMIAQDPSFIHAVAMQGAKSTPGRR